MRFGSKSKVCSLKLGEITEKADFKYQVQLGGVNSLFFVVLSRKPRARAPKVMIFQNYHNLGDIHENNVDKYKKTVLASFY